MKKTLSLILVSIMLFSCMVFSSSADPVWRGDADGNNKLNLIDVSRILKKIAGWDVEVSDIADYDGNGKLNLRDVSNILKYIAGWRITNDDLLEAEYGVSEVHFEIPDPLTTETVNGSEFGFSSESEDNSFALKAAALYLAENPGTHLVIEKNTYRLSAEVVFSGIKDCIIDWSGSTIILSQPIKQFKFDGCENVKFCNVTEKWDWEVNRIRSVIKVKSISPNPQRGYGYYDAEFEFVNETDASFAVNNLWYGWIGIEPGTYNQIPGTPLDLSSQNKRVFDKKLVGGNIVSATIFLDEGYPCDAGDFFYVSHYGYAGTFTTVTGASKGIVFEDMNVYGYSGNGFIIDDRSHHVRFTRVTIDVDPERYDLGQRISTNTDAIHIKDSCGYFIIEGTTIGYSGDDCLNIHQNVGVVQDLGDDSIIMNISNTSSFHVGETVKFRNGSTFENIDFTATIVKREVRGRLFYLTLDREIPDDIDIGAVVIDASRDDSKLIVRDSYFHNCYARGLLLGSSDCVVENNRFYEIDQEAIRVCVDITTIVWTEGAGTNNMIIRNNVFEKCNYLEHAWNNTVLNFFASNGFNTTQQSMFFGNCFENILIANNRFINPRGYSLYACNIKNFTFYGNDIEYPGDPYYNPDEIAGRIRISGLYFDGSSFVNNTWYRSDYTPEDVSSVKYNDRSDSTITIKGNTVK